MRYARDNFTLLTSYTIQNYYALNSISRQRGDPDESLLPLEPELSHFFNIVVL